MKRYQNPTLAAGTRVVVTSGPQRGQGGVIDKVQTFGAGIRYRVTDPDTHTVTGWFSETQLAATERETVRTERDAVGIRLLMGGES